MVYPSYAHVYNKTYKLGPRWLKSITKRQKWFSRHSISQKARWTKHIQTMLHTQHVASKIPPETRTELSHVTILTHIASLIMLRRLQRRIQQFLWRPGGPMMTRTYQNLLTATPSLPWAGLQSQAQ